ncbi:MAG: universal stress protein [Gemmatimonadaceae bacterium]
MQLRRIVIGMDFSDAAIAAARWVATALAPDAALAFVHVVDPPPRSRFGRAAIPPQQVVLDTAAEFARHRLDRVTRFVTNQETQRLVRVGRPHEALIAAARELEAELIVVGQHGDRPRPWKPLGTTADRLVRGSSISVLVAAAPPAHPPREILAAVDDAGNMPCVLQWTRELARTFHTDVTLMHVLSNAAYSHVTSMAHAHHALSEDEAEAEIRRELEGEGIRWIQSLADEGFGEGRATAAVTFGDPGDALLTMAETVHTDLLILGRHGSGAVAPALLGSTLGTVLAGARCPVLVVTCPTPT